MGTIYYDMGFLSTDEVIECSASDLIGQYVGQTSPKTKALLEKALGKVLFVDEAYRLADGQYAAEAVHEFVYQLGRPRYSGKIVVILAGYTQDMATLMTLRPSLSSLFPEQIVFEKLKPAECLVLLNRELKKRKIFASYLKDNVSKTYIHLSRLFRALSIFPTWGNARDIKTLAMQMASAAFEEMGKSHAQKPVLSETVAVGCVKDMIGLQRERSECKDGKRRGDATKRVLESNQDDPSPCLDADNDTAPRDDMAISTDAAEAPDPATLHCMRTNKAPPIDAAKRTNSGSNSLLGSPSAPQEPRLVAREDRTRAEIEKERKKHVAKQERLRAISACENGFDWDRIEGGYRCQGGTHFVSDEQFGSNDQ